jgi:hypothetical protein
MKNFLKNKSNVIILAFYGYFMIGLLGIANHLTKNLFLSLIPLTLLGISIIRIRKLYSLVFSCFAFSVISTSKR